MGFLSVRLFNFRNIRDGRVECDAPQVFLIGDNGQGKTNFIEAVYLLCYGASFRTRADRRLVRHGAEESLVQGRLRVPTSVEMEVCVRIGSGKEITVNGKAVRDRSELLQNVPCIVFCHDDFDFVTGAPERRRWFLNQTLSLCDALYLPALRTYRRVLSARNVLLRERNGDLLDHYDEQLASYGWEVQLRRESALQGFGEVFARLYGSVSGMREEVRLRYAPSWRGASGPADAVSRLRRVRERDLALGSTSTGPHRDSYMFVHKDDDFGHSASTGQLRLCALMLRVAQAHYLLERTGRKPILLLDDVILELDGVRKRAFLDHLPDRDQAFFTFLSDEEHASYRSAPSLCYAVREGAFEGRSES